MPAHTMHRIFVYGTLKRGCKNHAHIKDQTFETVARSLPGYRLYDLGQYPGLIEDAADGEGVAGEIWQVDAQALRRLDRFEGTTEGLYVRRAIRLAAPHDLQPVDAYFYLRPVTGYSAIGPEWTE